MAVALAVYSILIAIIVTSIRVYIAYRTFEKIHRDSERD